MQNAFRFRYLTFLTISILAVLGCAKNPLEGLSDEDSQVFITNYDKTANFSNYATFGIVDSVYVLNNNRVSRSVLEPEVLFINYIADNLTKRGFQRVQRSEKPDLGVNVARINNSYTNVVSNPISPYWNSYWGYGGGGSYYPSYYSAYTVSESYWYIEVSDLKNVAQSSNPKVIWNAEIRGNGIYDGTNLVALLDAVFAQSAYLKR